MPRNAFDPEPSAEFVACRLGTRCEHTKVSRHAGGIDMLPSGITLGFFVAKKQHGKRDIFYQKSLTHFQGDLDF
jgi:hypothetical protein